MNHNSPPACPPAPQRNLDARLRTQPLWARLRGSGLVRAHYTFYTPDDIWELEDSDVLEVLYQRYNPSSQAQTREEELYLQIMSLTIWARLRAL